METTKQQSRSLTRICLFVALAALTACGTTLETGLGAPPEVAGLEEAERRWKDAALTHYRVEYRIQGGVEVGPIWVEVRDGEIVDRGFEGQLEPEGLVRTIDDLFAEVRQVARDGEVLAAEFDAEFGYPTLLSLDPIPDAIDDEFAYVIIDVRRLVEATDESPEATSIEHRVLEDDIGTDGAEPYSVRVARDKDGLFALAAVLDIEAPTVDFSEEIVLNFNLAESNSCRFDAIADLVFDDPHQRLHPVVPLIDPGRESCEGDANPHGILLAVPRNALPAGGFSLWIDAQDPPGCCSDRLVFIAPGELNPPSADVVVLPANGAIAIGETKLATGIDTHCGVQRIFRSIDDSQWVTDAASFDSTPIEWQEAIDGDAGSGTLDLFVERIDVDSLSVTAAGTDHTITYRRASDAVACN